VSFRPAWNPVSKKQKQRGEKKDLGVLGLFQNSVKGACRKLGNYSMERLKKLKF
jgi:hypothetical protein